MITQRQKEERIYFAVIALGLACYMLALSGCACYDKTSESYNAPRCVVARQPIDCTTDAVQDHVRGLWPVVQWIVNGADRSTWDIDWITNTLMAMGFADVGCILAALENDFLSKSMAAPNMEPTKEHKVFSEWKKKHKGIGYKLANGVTVY